MKGSYLGPNYKNEEILDELEKLEQDLKNLRISQQNSFKLYKNGKAIGWFSGKMEFGPRSLGARSILADLGPEMQKLNLKIKFRKF